MAEIEERIAKLERTLRDVKIAGSGLVLALALFLGYTWTSIPRQIADAFKGEAVKKAEEAAIASAESARSAADSAKSQLERANTIVTKLESREKSTRYVLWGVNWLGNIFWSDDEGQSWNRVSGRLKQIAVGPGILWGVNEANQIFWSRDDGKSWNRVNGALKYIAISP